MDDIKRKIHDTFYKNILPVMDSLESSRLKKLEKYNLVKNLCIFLGFAPWALMLIPFCLTTVNNAEAFFLAFFLFLILFMICPLLTCGVIIGYAYYRKDVVSSFKKTLKDTFIPIILPYFEDLKLKYKDQVISREFLIESGLSASIFYPRADDVFTGEYNNVWFHIEELITGEETKAECRNIVIVFPTPKYIKSRTIINGYPPSTYKKVKLEDPAFNKNFSVYSKDQVEARYLVTPAFMERLKELQKNFGGNKIQCSFWAGKVMFAISTDRDLFEFGDLFTPLNDKMQIFKFVDELDAICKMIDHLKLNERTGL